MKINNEMIAFLERADKSLPWEAFHMFTSTYLVLSSVTVDDNKHKGLLRLLFISHWFDLSMEDTVYAYYDNQAIRNFCKLPHVPSFEVLADYRNTLKQFDLEYSLFIMSDAFLKDDKPVFELQ